MKRISVCPKCPLVLTEEDEIPPRLCLAEQEYGTHYYKCPNCDAIVRKKMGKFAYMGTGTAVPINKGFIEYYEFDEFGEAFLE